MNSSSLIDFKTANTLLMGSVIVLGEEFKARKPFGTTGNLTFSDGKIDASGTNGDDRCAFGEPIAD